MFRVTLYSRQACLVLMHPRSVYCCNGDNVWQCLCTWVVQGCYWSSLLASRLACSSAEFYSPSLLSLWKGLLINLFARTFWILRREVWAICTVVDDLEWPQGHFSYCKLFWLISRHAHFATNRNSWMGYHFNCAAEMLKVTGSNVK